MPGLTTAYLARLVLAAVALCACERGAFAPDRMASCYGVERGGQTFMRITKDSVGYVAHVRADAQWSTTRLRFPTANELQTIFHADTVRIAEGLIGTNERFGFFRTRRNAASKDTTSDYLLVVFLGNVPTYKVACEGETGPPNSTP